MTSARPGLTPEQEVALLARARTARPAAYAPYSGFAVGAAVLTAAGRVFTGVNVENAAFGASLCAERMAVGAAVTASCVDLVAIAVVGSDDRPCPPCGACRQVLSEFADELTVLTVGPGERVSRWALGADLLPHAFRLAPGGDEDRRVGHGGP